MGLSRRKFLTWLATTGLGALAPDRGAVARTPRRTVVPTAAATRTGDHILVTDGLRSKVEDFRYAHFDNEYYEREDDTDGHHVSDHDPPVLTFARGES